jgi:hypothetical protein
MNGRRIFRYLDGMILKTLGNLGWIFRDLNLVKLMDQKDLWGL